ncbi:uncharacterized protein LOC119839420 [Zerene cesonia]|uniref:uncharacterized protein LOC119839420 n=1 Tax=Zerene cesonia TaxID=33412 RepID=UPI0018E5117B|nr:uncharacterized protein LOC119839420 [Zerene cesonia]
MTTTRTPIKDLIEVTATTPPLSINNARTSNVRRSIEKLELGSAEPSSVENGKSASSTMTTAKTTSALTSRPKSALLSEGKNLIPQSDTKTTRSRLDEARTWNNKAKSALAISRNIKTEIKQDVTQAIEKLFQIVKESEAELASEKIKNGKEKVEKPSVTGARNRPNEEIDDRKRRGTNPREDQITECLEEHVKLLREHTKRMDELQVTVEKQTELLQKATSTAATYASVVATSRRSSNTTNACSTSISNKTMHSLAVTSKDTDKTGEEVLEIVRKTINAKEEGGKIDRVRKAKDSKIIISCQTKEEREEIKQRLNRAREQLEVEEMKNKNPLVIMRDVMNYNSDDDVLKALKSQNKKLLQGIKDEEITLEPRYRRKTHNPLKSHRVYRVPTALWQKLISAETIHIDIQQIKVADQSPLVQCSRCLGYGHARRFCKEEIDVCSHCGGPHMKAECADWQARTIPNCSNCQRVKNENTRHNAFDENCPVRRKWDDIARSTIAYC